MPSLRVIIYEQILLHATRVHDKAPILHIVGRRPRVAYRG